MRLLLLMNPRSDLRGDFAHEVEIEPAGGLGRCADADDADLRGFDGCCGIRGGIETALALRGLQQGFEFGLDDGRDACFERIHLRLLHIGTDDVMAEFGETACGDGPDIAEAEDADVVGR